MGMIAVVQVGKPTNLEAVKAFKAMGMPVDACWIFCRKFNPEASRN